jgi:hypothetical protein
LLQTLAGQAAMTPLAQGASADRLHNRRCTAARQTADSERFLRQSESARNGMDRYAKFATKGARRRNETVGISTVEFDRQVREGAARDVGQALLDYVGYRSPYDTVQFRSKYGLSYGNLFIAPQSLFDFHEAVVRAWADQTVSGPSNAR